MYGSPRIYRDCKAAGVTCSENRVAKLMQQAKLFAVRGYRKARYKSQASQRLQVLTDCAKCL